MRFSQFSLVLFSILILPIVGQAQATRQTVLLSEKFMLGETLIWTPGFQKCWDELRKAAQVEEILLKPETDIVRHLNSFSWDYEKTVPKKSHFVFLSGMGEQFRKRANELLFLHFGDSVKPLEKGYFRPYGESVPDEMVNGMVLLSILQHNLAFGETFEDFTEKFAFTSTKESTIYPKTFGSWGPHRSKHQGCAEVLHYSSDGSEFGLSFGEDSSETKLIIAKSLGSSTIGELIEHLSEWRTNSINRGNSRDRISASDSILMPVVDLKSYQDFAEQLRGVVNLPTGATMAIARAGQKVQLSLNKKGAAMVTKVFIVSPTYLSAGGVPQPSKPSQARNFLCNEPFFLVLWKKDADIPFFVARIDVSAIKI